ncbi:ribulose-phosphate 3-epimerase [Lacticaseibacillus parakribbianus]|uniref:ribulose-phosphate 3-epimerase n=1 Tax=Lacticaseibacillus parakribbianus TaxID=2970927 RepID=UPI0021CB5552|nr:ribulose-phosphate 3-epimerase [Lacticaseibacillus parakribbianus]
MKIATSILSADFAHLAQDIDAVAAAGADLLHVDVMDGHFVSNLTFGPGMVAAIRPITNLPLDVHLMVDDPQRWIPQFAKAGADTLLVHAEATPHLYGALQAVQQAGCKPGVVVNPGTGLATIEEVLPLVGQVLVMTVNPGFGGQKFIPAMTAKVKALAALRQRLGLRFDIEVDGGISAVTAPAVLAAGADILVAGSFIYAAGRPATQIAKLRQVAR